MFDVVCYLKLEAIRMIYLIRVTDLPRMQRGKRGSWDRITTTKNLPMCLGLYLASFKSKNL